MTIIVIECKKKENRVLSSYFRVKTADNGFIEKLNNIVSELSDKKILIYGAGEGFIALDRKYEFTKKLTITAIADKKYETEDKIPYNNIRTISPDELTTEEFDYILVTNEFSKPIVNFLTNNLNIDIEKIKTIFEEDIKDERININYLYKLKFEKTLPQLKKRLKGKKIVFYGAGVYLKIIQKYFDLSELNIIGISDRKYELNKEEDSFLGYKTIAPSEIKDINPDFVVVATKNYIPIVEDLHYNILHGTNIKIKALVKKPLWTLIKEIWCS